MQVSCKCGWSRKAPKSACYDQARFEGCPKCGGSKLTVSEGQPFDYLPNGDLKADLLYDLTREERDIIELENPED